jgi:dUTP pyrophosphatase
MRKINIINKSNNSLPTYATEGSAGMDLRANLDKEIVIKSLERCVIPTGIFIELPIGYEAQIRPRSGLAFNCGVTILNTPGTIDSDYRGEIKIILINLSNQDFLVKHGDRIGQMIISKYETIELNLIDEFEVSTKRGVGGFGSTGF